MRKHRDETIPSRHCEDTMRQHRDGIIPSRHCEDTMRKHRDEAIPLRFLTITGRGRWGRDCFVTAETAAPRNDENRMGSVPNVK